MRQARDQHGNILFRAVCIVSPTTSKEVVDRLMYWAPGLGQAAMGVPLTAISTVQARACPADTQPECEEETFTVCQNSELVYDAYFDMCVCPDGSFYTGSCDGEGTSDGPGDGSDPSGGGGPSGPGSDSPPPAEPEDESFTDVEIEEMCREEEKNCDPRPIAEWTPAEVQAVDNAIALVLSRCTDEGQLLSTWRQALRLYLWDGRVVRGNDVLRGRVDPVTNDIYIWTGYNWQTNDGRPVNWAEVLAHEAQHVLETFDGIDVPHEDIRVRAAYCANVPYP